jgi:hypothetical protein
VKRSNIYKFGTLLILLALSVHFISNFVSDSRSLVVSMPPGATPSQMVEISFDTGDGFQPGKSETRWFDRESATGELRYAMPSLRSIKSLRISLHGPELALKSLRVEQTFHFVGLQLDRVTEWPARDLVALFPSMHDSEWQLDSSGFTKLRAIGSDPYTFTSPSAVNFRQIHYQSYQNLRLILSLVALIFILVVWALWSRIGQQPARWLLGSILIFGAIVVSAPPDGLQMFLVLLVLFLLFVVPGHLVLRGAEFYPTLAYWERVVLTLGAGSSIVLAFVYLVAIAGMNLQDWFFQGASLLSGLLCIVGCWRLFRFSQPVVAVRVSWEDCLAAALFVCGVVVYIGPVKGLLVPPLHDPVFNTVVASALNERGFAFDNLPQYTRFYPPLSAYLYAVVSAVTGSGSEKFALLGTNLFNLLSAFAFGMFCKRLCKSSFAFLAGFVAITVICPFIPDLYFTAGKNAQIFAYFFMFTALAMALFAARSEQPVWKYLVGLMLAVSILIHYNNLIAGLGVTLIAIVWSTVGKQGLGRNIAKNFLHWVLSAAVASAILGFHYLKISQMEFLGAELSSEVSGVESLRLHPGLYNTIYELLAKNSRLVPMAQPLAVFGWGAALLMLGVQAYRRRLDRVAVFILVWPIIVAVLMHIDIRSVRAYSTLLDFMAPLVPLVYLLTIIVAWSLPARIVVSVLLLGFWLHGIRGTSTKYLGSRARAPVGPGDILAYDWIKDHIPLDQYFLPGTVHGLLRKNEPFVGDGTMYLTPFTGRESVINFSGADKFSHKEYDTRNQYHEWVSDLSNVAIRQSFWDKGIRYLYYGAVQPWGVGPIEPHRFDQHPDVFEKVYSHSEVRIYRFREPPSR